MHSITTRQLIGVARNRDIFGTYSYFRYVHRRAPRPRWSNEAAVDDRNAAAKDKEADRDQKPNNVSDEELKWMYDNKVYNTEMWDKVMKHKIDSFKKSRSWSSRSSQLDTLDNLSIIAKLMVESSGYQPRKFEDNKVAEVSTQISTVDADLVKCEERNFPFAPVDVERRRDRLLLQQKTDESILREAMGDGNLPDVPSTFSTDNLASSTAVEKIVLEGPYQKLGKVKKEAAEQKSKWKIFYGTPDPNVPISKSPCGGCGAFLHCQDPGLAGYLPSEILTRMTDLELQDVICQRCTFLKDYNLALNLSVPPETYPEIISRIKEKRALVVLMVDLLDFPCSIWPGIVDLVGPKQPILVVGNKVDLLPKDGRDYLDRIRNTLCQAMKDYGIDNGRNVKNVCLISAKTGYGIEELITDIHSHWGASGDIYLIGCTNVGKSSLFNALLQSDLCKVQAMDLIQRATISIWPGTTLNLLRFPVLRPSPWRLVLRQQRLKSWNYEIMQEQKLRELKLKETNNLEYATLIGHVGLTYKTSPIDNEVALSRDAFKLAAGENADIPQRRLKKFNPEGYEYKMGKWLYDTPGSVHKDQIITLLTMEELSWTIPKRYTPPRCFIVKPGQTLFLAGLGRIDYIEGEKSTTCMVFSSLELPVSVMATKFADDFYRKYLGTDVMKVPYGNSQRLKDFPELVPKEFSVTGQGSKQCCADILLSSAGWISFVLEYGMVAKLLAYTPSGRGCYIREPPLLKYAIRLRGKRQLYTPACDPSKISIENDREYLYN